MEVVLPIYRIKKNYMMDTIPSASISTSINDHTLSGDDNINFLPEIHKLYN